MRVLILGIDALEYDLVEKWDLKYLKQLEYGKTSVPINKSVGEPATLEVWTSFITGKLPGEYGYEGLMIYKEPIKSLFDKFYFNNVKTKEYNDLENFKRSTRRKLLDLVSMGLMKLKLAERPQRKHIKVPTIFDGEGRIHQHIPVYDTNAFPDYRKYTATDALENPDYKPQYEKDCSVEFNARTSITLKTMECHWNLYMNYFFLLDGIQHVFFKNKLKIMNWYFKFNQFVKEVTERLPDNTLLLIVSDHGQKKGIHTKHGFYSCNKKLGLVNPDIIDFKDIIEEKLKNDIKL